MNSSKQQDRQPNPKHIEMSEFACHGHISKENKPVGLEAKQLLVNFNKTNNYAHVL